MLRTALSVAALACFSGAALAQEPVITAPDPMKPAGWQFTLGAGILTSPLYEGDNDHHISVLPNVQVKYGERFFASVQEGVGYKAFHSEYFSAGPIARVKFSRDEDGEQFFSVSGGGTNDLLGLGDVDTSWEFGGFAEYKLGAVTFGAEARQAVSGHEGFAAELGAKWTGFSTGLGLPFLWSVGPRVKIVDSKYNSAYFGVTGAQSLRSGLPVYNAGGGLYSYGAGAMAIVPLNRELTWSFVLFGLYDRLTDDAGNAPLVQLRGSQDQFVAGAFISHIFE